MKTTKEIIEIIQAYEKGASIQEKEIVDDVEYYAKWEDVENPLWNFENYDYRVKPKPKYAPFSTAEQFLEAQEKHGQAVIQYVNKDNTVCNQFRAYVNNLGNIVLYGGVNTVRLLTLEQLFNDYYFANDLAPCGKIID